MSFRREVDDGVDLDGQRIDQLCIADITLHKPVSRLVLELDEVGKIPRVGQLVEDGDCNLGSRSTDMANEVRTYEAGSACDQEPFEGTGHLMAGPAVQS